MTPYLLDPDKSPAANDFAAVGGPDDSALADWFAYLPVRSPRPGFVLRVLSALPRRSWLDSRWSRGSLVAALAAVALAAAVLVPALVPLVRLVGPAGLLNLWIGTVADLLSQLGGAISAWSTAANVGKVLGRALAMPPLAGLLALNAALALAAFRGLVALSSKRSSAHAALPV